MNNPRKTNFPASIPRIDPGATQSNPPGDTAKVGTSPKPSIKVWNILGQRFVAMKRDRVRPARRVAISRAPRVTTDRSTRAPRKSSGTVSMVLVVLALLMLVGGYLPSMGQGQADALNIVTPDPNATVTPTPFQPEPIKINAGTCGDNEYFMPMYDQKDPSTGLFGIGVTVFDSQPSQKVCIPEWSLFEQMIANGKSGDGLLKDQVFVDYTGKLAYRMAITLGIPDSDNVARQGLRRAIAEALKMALESPQPADDGTSGMRHGYIMMPGKAMIDAATALVKKEVAAKPNLPQVVLPNANNGQVVKTVPTPREILEKQVRAECTTKAAPDIEACVKTIVDTYLAKPEKEQTPDVMKGLIVNYFTMLTPPATNAPIVVPGDNSFSTFEKKVVEACALTKHPESCVSVTKKSYAETNDLYAALKQGVPAGNAECSVYISEIAFADMSARSDIWSAAGTLHVWRIDNNDPSTLTGVGYANGVYAVCVDKITGAPSTVAGGIWQTRSDNVMYSASDYAKQYSGGGYLTGGIISLGSLYPADPNGGIYHSTVDDGGVYQRTVYEVQIGGLHVSPVIGEGSAVVQVYPTPTENTIAWPVYEQIVVSTPGPSPMPADVTLSSVYDWASARGYTMFYLRMSCSGTPPTIAAMNDGRFAANVDLSGYSTGCPNGYFSITTDNMTGKSGWANVGGVWYTTQ